MTSSWAGRTRFNGGPREISGAIQVFPLQEETPAASRSGSSLLQGRMFHQMAARRLARRYVGRIWPPGDSWGQIGQVPSTKWMPADILEPSKGELLISGS